MNKNSVTLEGIRAKVVKTEFLYHATLTIALLTLENGYTVRGESACVDPANYNRAKGEQYAVEDAERKVWPLEGYLLKQRLYMQQSVKDATDMGSVTFGAAVEALKDGQRVTRSGWNGKGMWLELQVPDAHSKMSLPYIYMRTAQGDLVPWLASQTDVLANDWMTL